MKKQLLLTLLSSILSTSAFAASKGNALLFQIDFGDPRIPIETVVTVDREVARDIFESMTKPVKAKTYTNTCTLSNGSHLSVQVERRSGVSFSCEKWPADCWGKVVYMCGASLNPESGKLKARN